MFVSILAFTNKTYHCSHVCFAEWMEAENWGNRLGLAHLENGLYRRYGMNFEVCITEYSYTTVFHRPKITKIFFVVLSDIFRSKHFSIAPGEYTWLNPEVRSGVTTVLESVNEQQNKIFARPFIPATLFKLYQPPFSKWARWIKEAVHIRKEGHRAMNRDEGSYQLSHAYSMTAFLMRQLIVAPRLGRTEYQLLLIQISWWDRNVNIRYKRLVVIDEFSTLPAAIENSNSTASDLLCRYKLRYIWTTRLKFRSGVIVQRITEDILKFLQIRSRQ